MSYLEKAKQLRPYIEKGVQSLTDAEALQAKTLHPKWEAGKDYKEGLRLLHEGDLYRVRQTHTSQESWPPSTDTAALYTHIDETHAGTLEDPIPYEGNMALENGKYYSQAGVVYKCTRDTGSPVHHALAELVGIYVEAV